MALFDSSLLENRRPVLSVPRSSLEVFLELLAAVGLVLLLIVPFDCWPELPQRIPTHFGASGRPDAWGPRNVLLLLPAIGSGIYVMLTGLSFFPHRFNYYTAITTENAPRQYQIARALLAAVKVEVMWLFAYIVWGTVQVSLGKAEGLGAAILPAVLIGTLGTVAVGLYCSWEAR